MILAVTNRPFSRLLIVNWSAVGNARRNAAKKQVCPAGRLKSLGMTFSHANMTGGYTRYWLGLVLGTFSGVRLAAFSTNKPG